MKVSVTVTSDINIERMIAKIDNDKFWTFAATQWWVLYQPWVPKDTGNLAETVDISPKTIEHNTKYAVRQYFGEKFKFSKEKHPLASAKWDKSAQPTQESKLIQSLQEYIDSGKMGLSNEYTRKDS